MSLIFIHILLTFKRVYQQDVTLNLALTYWYIKDKEKYEHINTNYNNNKLKKWLHLL